MSQLTSNTLSLKMLGKFSEGQLHLILVVVVVVRRYKHRQNQHLAVQQWQNKLQKSVFRGDNTVGSSSTPARSGKNNHVVALIISKVMDILVELTKIANKNINFQCDDDNSCSRGRIFAAIARLEAAGHQLEAERKITLFGQVFIKLWIF